MTAAGLESLGGDWATRSAGERISLLCSKQELAELRVFFGKRQAEGRILRRPDNAVDPFDAVQRGADLRDQRIVGDIHVRSASFRKHIDLLADTRLLQGDVGADLLLVGLEAMIGDDDEGCAIGDTRGLRGVYQLL